MLPGSGFSLYGVEHLAFLAGIAIFVGLMCVFYKNANEKAQLKFRRIVACTCFGLEMLKQVVLFIILPSYPISQLPLHLCGLGCFVQMFDAFVTKWNKTTREILYSLSLPGGLAALIFADWTTYPILSFFCLQSFTIHALLVCYPAMLLFAKQLKPNWRELWRPAVFLVVVAVPLFFVNRLFNTNFLFINGGTQGSPVELLVNLMGNPTYLIGYAGLVLVIWLVIYLPFIITGRKRKALAGN